MLNIIKWSLIFLDVSHTRKVLPNFHYFIGIMTKRFTYIHYQRQLLIFIMWPINGKKVWYSTSTTTYKNVILPIYYQFYFRRGHSNNNLSCNWINFSFRLEFHVILIGYMGRFLTQHLFHFIFLTQEIFYLHLLCACVKVSFLRLYSFLISVPITSDITVDRIRLKNFPPIQ